MSDTVTVTVTVDAPPPTGTTSRPPPVPRHGRTPFLPTTGLATASLLAVAFVLLLLGVALTWRFRMRTRTTIALGALLLTAAAALPALADAESTTVSVTALGPGSRQVDLLDMAGQPLTDLALTPGVAKSFRVRVTDDQIADLANGFQVSAVMSNLYRSDGGGGYVWADRIGSGDVAISYPANPFTSLATSYHALAKVAVSGTLPNCATLSTASGVAVATLTSAGLCTIVGAAGGGYTLPVAVTVPSVLDALIDGAARAPYDMSGNEPGTFDDPDYSVGIGAAAVGNDPDAVANQTGSARSVAVGQFTGVSNLLGDLNAVLGSLSAGLDDVSPTGSGAYTQLADVLTSMSAQGQSALANAIAALPSSASQVAVLDELTFSLLTPTVSDLSREVGTYNAFPMLTVSPSGTVSTGTYQGTLTVTMVQP